MQDKDLTLGSSAYQPSGDSKQGYGKAHSKIILMGEHAVVYDYPAIAIPFNPARVEVYVKANGLPTSTLECRYYTGTLQEAPSHLNNLKETIKLTLSYLDQVAEGLHYQINSSIPSGRGMGSSAAVCVAIVRALVNYYQADISEDLMRLIVNQAEVIAHGSTSGLDTLMTSNQQAVIYRKSQEPKPFHLTLDAYLVVADSGQEGRTKEAVGLVAKLKDKRPRFVTEAMESIGDFVYKGYQALKNRDALELGRLMTYNHYYLNQLQVSNQRLDQIVQAAWLAGALGAKLTGGGLGGCSIALADTWSASRKIETAMQMAGASQTWTLSLKEL